MRDRDDGYATVTPETTPTRYPTDWALALERATGEPLNQGQHLGQRTRFARQIEAVVLSQLAIYPTRIRSAGGSG